MKKLNIKGLIKHFNAYHLVSNVNIKLGVYKLQVISVAIHKQVCAIWNMCENTSIFGSRSAIN